MLLVVIALICVAVNALGAFGLYTRNDMTKAERYTLSQGSGGSFESLKQQHGRSTRTSRAACRSSTPSSATCAICSRSTRTRAAASSTTRSSRPKTTTRRRTRPRKRVSSRASVEESETRRQGRHRAGLHGPRLQVRRREGRHPGALAGPDDAASSSGSRTRSASFATRATTSSTRSASSPATTR